MYLDYIKMGKIVWIPVHRAKAPASAQAQDPSVPSKSKKYWGGYGHHGYGHHWGRYGYGYPWYGLYTEQRYPYV